LAGAGAERKKTVLSEIGECEFIFMQLNVRESGENPERLRHCNGLQTPINHWTAYAVREGRSEVQARSQNTGLIALVAVPQRGTSFSAKRRMRPDSAARAAWDFLNAFIFRICGV
jgi:hypothetical protein